MTSLQSYESQSNAYRGFGRSSARLGFAERGPAWIALARQQQTNPFSNTLKEKSPPTKFKK